MSNVLIVSSKTFPRLQLQGYGCAVSESEGLCQPRE